MFVNVTKLTHRVEFSNLQILRYFIIFTKVAFSVPFPYINNSDLFWQEFFFGFVPSLEGAGWVMLEKASSLPFLLSPSLLPCFPSLPYFLATFPSV